MGNKISRWAERQLPQLTHASEKLVLMVLASTADHDGLCPAETSIATVAQRSTLAKSSAAKSLLRLRDAGVLRIDPQHDDTGATIKNVYQLAIKGCTEDEYTPVPRMSTPPVPSSGTDPYSSSVHPVPRMSTPLTCENAEGVPRSGQPTSFLHPSDVAAPRTPAPAHTPTRVHDARTREQPPPPKTQRQQNLDALNATAIHPDTRPLITAWCASHATPVTERLLKQMTAEVDRAVRTDHDLDCLAAALREWNARPDLFSAKVLSGLYDDAVSRRNAGQAPDRPLIDENGMPRTDPQQIPDSYLTRSIVNRVLGSDSQQPPLYAPDAEHPDGYTDANDHAARKVFFTRWQDDRLAERRPLARRALIKLWNRRVGAA